MSDKFSSWCLALSLLPLLVGCATARLAEPAGQPISDSEGFARATIEQSHPTTPRHVTFAWSLDEGGSRVRGRGVVRSQAPDRIRLDLFGPRDETYLTAALVDEQYRLPPAAVPAVNLPSPALLWSALGVLKPPIDSRLLSATETDEGAELRYESENGEVFAYTLVRAPEGGYRLARLERAGGQGVIETVSLERGADGALTRTRYRDWSAYRDLTLDIESARESGPFSPDIWRPDGVTP